MEKTHYPTETTEIKTLNIAPTQYIFSVQGVDGQPIASMDLQGKMHFTREPEEGARVFWAAVSQHARDMITSIKGKPIVEIVG